LRRLDLDGFAFADKTTGGGMKSRATSSASPMVAPACHRRGVGRLDGANHARWGFAIA
jgi:hypothetical protein